MSQLIEKTSEKYTQIARVGTFNDSQGRPHTFTAKDFDEIANTYNNTDTQAPLVIGHVESDKSPAYAWVKNLKSENGKLFARFAHVSEKVKEWVYKGLYKNVSMSVDVNKKRLLHIALLGAAAPAIDGIGEINLSAEINFSSINNDETISINFSQEQQEQNEQDEKLLTREDTMTIEEVQKQLQESMGKIASLEAEKQGLTSENEAVKAEFSAYKANEADEKRKNRIQKLVDDGKLPPAKQEEVLAFANQLAKSPADFSLGSESVSMEEKYLQELESRESSMLFSDFSSFASKPKHAKGDSKTNYNPDMTASRL